MEAMADEVKEVDREDLLQRTLVTGRTYEFRLGADKGELHLVIFDHTGQTPVPGMDYEITGPHGVSHKSKTDAKGVIHHAEPLVPIDRYTLKINKKDIPIESRIPGLPPHEVRLDGWPEAHPLEMNPEADVVILRKKSGAPPAGLTQDVPCYRQGGEPGRPWNYEDPVKVRGEIHLARHYTPTYDRAKKKHRNIANVGCGLVSLTMAIAAAGIKCWRFSKEKNDWVCTGEPIHPRNLADFFMDYCEQNYKDAGKNAVWRIFNRDAPSGALKWKEREDAPPSAGGSKGKRKKKIEVPARPLFSALSFLVQKHTGQPDRQVSCVFLSGGGLGKKVQAFNDNLLQGRPIVVLLGRPGGACGHFMLCVGYKREQKGEGLLLLRERPRQLERPEPVLRDQQGQAQGLPVQHAQRRRPPDQREDAHEEALRQDLRGDGPHGDRRPLGSRTLVAASQVGGALAATSWAAAARRLFPRPRPWPCARAASRAASSRARGRAARSTCRTRGRPCSRWG